MGVFRLRGDVALLCCALSFWSGHQIGAIFHRNKTYADELARGVARPAVFHWAWTEGRDDKLRFARETNTWHVRDSCDAAAVAALASGAKLLADCCLRPEPGPLRDFSATPPPGGKGGAS